MADNLVNGRICSEQQHLDCPVVTDLEERIYELENEVCLLKQEKQGLRDGYIKVKEELDRRKGLKKGHTIVRDRPDTDYPKGIIIQKLGHSQEMIRPYMDRPEEEADMASSDGVVTHDTETG